MTIRLTGAAIAFGALVAALVVACGGDAGNGPAGASPADSRPAAGPTVLGPNDPGGNIQAVPGSNVFGIATPTPPAAADATPSATPPPVTIEETQTSILVDELSFEEYPRWPARDLEAVFRNEPDRGTAMIGTNAVIRGIVRESGRNSAGDPYVTFGAGSGNVTCWFAEITDVELRRLAPGGNNSVVGRLAEWDAANRLLTARECRLVRGY